MRKIGLGFGLAFALATGVASSSSASGLVSSFELRSTPNPTAVIENCYPASTRGFCVRVNDRAVDGKNNRVWRYDAGRNAIVFASNAVPPPGASVKITYETVE